MKTKLFLFVFLMITLGIRAQVVNIPDANFKARLLSASPNNEIAKNLNGVFFKIDANNDGQIQASEAQQVSYLSLSNPGYNYIADITGILSFTNLTKLDIIYEKIPTIDLHGLSQLKYFRYYPYSAIVLTNTSLNIQGTNLISLEIPGFRLSSLNIQHCPNLEVFDYSVNPNLSVNLQSLPHLKVLKCSNNQLTSLNLQGLNNITDLDCSYNNISTLDVLHLSNLKYLKCIMNPLLTDLDVHGLTQLQELGISNHILVNLNASGCTSLSNYSYYFVYSGYVPTLKSLNFEGCKSLGLAGLGSFAPSLEYLNVKDTNIVELYASNLELNYLNVEGCIYLKNLDCSNNNLSSLNVQGCTNLRQLNCSYNNISTLDLHGMNISGENTSVGQWTNYIAGVDCSHNSITNLNISNLTTNFINCSYNNISALDFQTFSLVGVPGIATTNLKPFIDCSHNNLSTINLKENLILERLDCSYNNVSSLSINKMNALILNASHNMLTSLNIDSFSHINSLDFGFNNMTSFTCHSLPIVDPMLLDYYSYYYPSGISCANNLLTSLNVQGLQLDTLNCSNNLLTTLDLNESSLGSFNADNNQLQYLFIKNGIFDNYSIADNPNLTYICLDDMTAPFDPTYTELLMAQDTVAYLNLNNVSINTYCNFTPGGNYNTITGTVRFDENNNGCDTNDEVFEHMKLKINDGTTTGETFVKNDGKYNFYTQAGDFTVTVEPENPSLFTVTPSTFTTHFANANNNVSTQNICVTKNGNVKDLEVVFAPATDARPGFDAVYQLIWRNKGNTTLSGNVTLTFENTKMAFISSELPSTVSGNMITFSFTNLKPFANTSSELTFNINPPTHPTYPVNIGNTLNFNAIINSPSGENTPEDNEFVFKQTVVGSFDPNDITCLEGSQIPLSMVGKYLHYIINFENTGTAPATNIVVEMNVNPDDFDISSLQLQNTSHSTYTKITGNKAEFIMKDINLAALAHGNITLKVKSNNNLATGDSVSNQANIYFDYNFPVETNEAITMIKNPTLETIDTAINNKVNVYPNPTKDDVNILTDSKIKSIEVYDAQGRIIQKHMGINAQNAKVSIRSTASGLYIFKIITEKEVIMKKVIKN